MKTLLTFILCLLSVSAFGQYRPNTYTTNRQAQADAYIISIVSGPTNGITATVATNIAAYQASLATNGLSAELWDWNDTTLEIFANGFKSGDQNLLLQAESDGDKVVFLGGMLGDGSPITNLNASSIASGTLADARLSTNVFYGDPTAADYVYRIRNVTNAADNSYMLRMTTHAYEGSSATRIAGVLGEVDLIEQAYDYPEIYGLYGYPHSHLPAGSEVNTLGGLLLYPANQGGGHAENLIGVNMTLQNVSTGTVNNAYGINFNNPDNTGGGTMTNVAALLVQELYTGTNRYSVRSVGTNAMLYHKGNVGINVEPSNYPFELKSRAVNTIPMAIYEADGTALMYVREDASGNGWLSVYDSGSARATLHTAGDSYLTGGDVGIGISSPTAALHVTNRQAQAQVFRVDAPSLTDAFSVNTSGQTVIGGAGLYGLLPSGAVTNAAGSRVAYESDITAGSGQTNNVVLAPGSNITIATNTPAAGTTLYTITSAGGADANNPWTYVDALWNWPDLTGGDPQYSNVGKFSTTNILYLQRPGSLLFSGADETDPSASQIAFLGYQFRIGAIDFSTNNWAFGIDQAIKQVQIHKDYELVVDSATFTNMNVSTITATTVVGDGSGLTNIAPSNVLSGTFNGALYTTASTASNSPAQNEIPTAGWVRGLFEGAGATYYATPFIATGTTNNSYDFGTNYILSATAPADGSILVTGPTNGQYFMAFCTTNRFLQIRSGIGINAYLFSLNGGGSGGPQVNPEAYYSYDGTNWYGDWGAEAKYIPEAATTNLAQWIISNPSYTSTNATGFLVGGRMKMVTQTSPASDLVLAYGATFPSHMTLSIADTGSGNVYAAANNTLTGSNAFTGTLYSENGMTFKTNAMSGLVLALGQTAYTNLQSDITISGFSGGDHNYWRQGLLVVTNGTAAVHTLTWPAGVRVLTNAITPNRVVYCTNSAVTMISYGVGFNMTNVAASGCYGQ